MKREFRTLLMLASTLMPAFCGVSFAQDSPQVLADRFLAEADEQLGQGKAEAARAAMSEALDLHRQQGARLPPQFYLKYGRILNLCGAAAEAMEALQRYLATGVRRPVPKTGVGAPGEGGGQAPVGRGQDGQRPRIDPRPGGRGGRSQGPG